MTDLPFSYTFTDSLRMLSVKKRQGVLEVLAGDREYEITFHDGKIVHAERMDLPFSEFLLRSLSVEQIRGLDSNLFADRARAELIEYVKKSGVVSFEELITLKRKYDTETLRNLATESSLSFDFRAKIIRCSDEISLDLSPGHLLLDILEAAQGDNPEALHVSSKAAATNEEIKKVVTLVEALPDEVSAIRPAIVKTVSAGDSHSGSQRLGLADTGHITENVAAKIKKMPAFAFWSILKVGDTNSMLLGAKIILALSLVLYVPVFLRNWLLTLSMFFNVQ